MPATLRPAAISARAPLRGQVTAVLVTEQHLDFWHALDLDELASGERNDPTIDQLADAWQPHRSLPRRRRARETAASPARPGAPPRRPDGLIAVH